MCEPSIDAVLTVMEQLEKSASKLYKLLYYTFDTKDNEAAFFFYRMHLEEKTHCLLVQYLRGMVDSIGVTTFDIGASECVKALGFYDIQINDIIKNLRNPSVETALNIALQLETEYAVLYREIVQSHFQHPIMTELIRSLVDESHTNDIKEFMEGRKNKWQY